MFGNNSKQKTGKIDTLVGSSTELNGDISYTGGLHVEGVIKGNVSSNGDDSSLLIVAVTGRIEGEVNVPNVSVNGTVIGDIHASQHVELAKNAKITGCIYYKVIEMEPGAEVNGQLVQKPSVKDKGKGFDAALTAVNDDGNKLDKSTGFAKLGGLDKVSGKP